jgi:hypothetical protein
VEVRGVVVRGFVMCVDGFAMRVDDWEVTLHHLPASLQPIRAEQIGCWWALLLIDTELHYWALRNRPWGR